MAVAWANGRASLDFVRRKIFASRRRLRPPRPASNVPSRHAMMLKLPCVRGSGGSSTWSSCEAAAQSLERNEQ